jgi:hypothetical protein
MNAVSYICEIKTMIKVKSRSNGTFRIDTQEPPNGNKNTRKKVRHEIEMATAETEQTTFVACSRNFFFF